MWRFSIGPKYCIFKNLKNWTPKRTIVHHGTNKLSEAEFVPPGICPHVTVPGLVVVGDLLFRGLEVAPSSWSVTVPAGAGEDLHGGGEGQESQQEQQDKLHNYYIPGGGCA